MAYNTKYILNYCNIKRIPLRIEIAQRDYTGESFIIVNEDDYLQDEDENYITLRRGVYDPDRDINGISGTSIPFRLEYRNDFEGKRCVIKATSANLSFWSDMNFNIDDLKTSDETELLVRFYYDNQLEWTGFVVPDFFTEEIGVISEVNLTASDRIGILKDIDYPTDDLNDNRKSLMAILDTCIKYTGLDLPYKVILDIECEEWNTSFENALLNTFVSERRFIESDTKNMSCYDVIQKVLSSFNCGLTQKRGHWVIFNKQQIEVGNGNVVNHSSDLSTTIVEPFEQEINHFNSIERGGQRTIMPVGALTTINLDLGNDMIYPKNRTFTKSNPLLLNPDAWANLGLNYSLTNQLPTDYLTNGQIDEYRVDSRQWLRVNDSYIRPTWWDGFQDVKGINVTWNHMSQEFKVASIDGKRLKFDLTVRALGKPNTFVNVMVLLTFSDQPNKYFSLADDGKLYDISNVIIDGAQGYRTNRVLQLQFNNEYGNDLISVEQEFKLSVTAAAGKHQQDLDLNNASLEIRIYPNTHDVSGTFTALNVVKEVRVDFLMADETPKSIIFEGKITQGNFTKKYDEIDVVLGDYQTFGQNGYFYKYRDDSNSILYASDGTKTVNWNTINDDTNQPLLVHTMRQNAIALGRPTDELNIVTSFDRLDPIGKYAIACDSWKDIIIRERDLVDTNNYNIQGMQTTIKQNKYYTLVSGSIDYMRCDASVVLIECQQNDVILEEYIYSEF